MKSNILLSVLLFLISASHAQELKFDAGLGLGTTLHSGSLGLGKVWFTSAFNYRTDHWFDFSLDFLTWLLTLSDHSPVVSI